MKRNEKATTVAIPIDTLAKAKCIGAFERRGTGAFVANLIEEKYKRMLKVVGFKGVEND